MLTNFICPDKELQPTELCTSGKCRMKERCAPLSFLINAAQERKWEGKPSVTQLLKGTREMYLTITTPYSIRPFSRAYSILGTKAHASLDEDHAWGYFEERLENEISTGQFDCIEYQENGEAWLIDYKTSGAFAVRKMIGITATKEFVYDVDGSPVYLKTGKNKGEPKTITVYKRGGEQDFSNYDIQLNFYRMLVEHKLNIKISRMKIFAIIRDGGMKAAREQGLPFECEYIDVPFIEDEKLVSILKPKREALLKALEDKVVPPPCTAREAWDGRKCSGYCVVRDECLKYGNPYIKGEINEDSN